MGCRPVSGFTLVETVLALLLLVVGVLAFLGSSAMATRMIGWGRWATLASHVATARLDGLRRLAASTSPPCAHPQLTGGSASTGGIRERWELGAAGNARPITLELEYRTPGGFIRDTLLTAVVCR